MCCIVANRRSVISMRRALTVSTTMIDEGGSGSLYSAASAGNCRAVENLQCSDNRWEECFSLEASAFTAKINDCNTP